MELGDVIKDYRELHELSLRAFAAKAGLSATYIMSLENGRTARGNKPTPSIETYKSVAKAMSMELDSLLKIVDGDVTIPPSDPPPLTDTQKELYTKLCTFSDEKCRAWLKILEEE